MVTLSWHCTGKQTSRTSAFKEACDYGDSLASQCVIYHILQKNPAMGPKRGSSHTFTLFLLYTCKGSGQGVRAQLKYRQCYVKTFGFETCSQVINMAEGYDIALMKIALIMQTSRR